MKNNLYIKPEKYKQKVWKVRFLEVVIELEGIKIEEEKVKDVLDWLTPKGVLSIKCEDRKQRLVTFLSKSLNEIERNYEIHNKEMLAIIRGSENQRHILKDAKFNFKVWMNYKNLEYFMKTQKLNRKQVCQVLYLLKFNFTLKYVLETKIGKVDRLSRRLD